jgi:hypothetical protein
VEEARTIADEIVEVMAELEEDRDLILDTIDRLAPKKGKSNRKVKGRKVSKAERSDLIRKYAMESAATHGGTITIVDLANTISGQGFDLNTNIPGTVIANVLMKSPDWDRVEKGVFRFLRQEYKP